MNNVPDAVLKNRKGGKTQSLEDYEDYEVSGGPPMARGRGGRVFLHFKP